MSGKRRTVPYPIKNPEQKPSKKTGVSFEELERQRELHIRTFQNQVQKSNKHAAKARQDLPTSSNSVRFPYLGQRVSKNLKKSGKTYIRKNHAKKTWKGGEKTEETERNDDVRSSESPVVENAEGEPIVEEEPMEPEYPPDQYIRVELEGQAPFHLPIIGNFDEENEKIEEEEVIEEEQEETEFSLGHDVKIEENDQSSPLSGNLWPIEEKFGTETDHSPNPSFSLEREIKVEENLQFLVPDEIKMEQNNGNEMEFGYGELGMDSSVPGCSEARIANRDRSSSHSPSPAPQGPEDIEETFEQVEKSLLNFFKTLRNHNKTMSVKERKKYVDRIATLAKHFNHEAKDVFKVPKAINENLKKPAQNLKNLKNKK